MLHLFPLMADAQSFHPLHPLKFAVTPPYANDIAAGLDTLLTMHRMRKIKVGVLYETNAFGVNVLDGAQTALARHHLKPVAKVGFPAGATNLRSEIAKLKAAHADIVVLGTVVQDTIAALRAARGWHPIFLCSAACYTPETTTLGGTLVEGTLCRGRCANSLRQRRQSEIARLGQQLSTKIRHDGHASGVTGLSECAPVR